MSERKLSEAQLDYLVKRLRSATAEEENLAPYLWKVAADAIDQCRAALSIKETE